MTTKTAAKKSSAKSSNKAAPKAAKKVAATAERAAVLPDEAKLTVLVKENPKRGAKARRIFDLYMKNKTVGAWRVAMHKAKLDLGYLHNDIRRGLIKVVAK